MRWFWIAAYGLVGFGVGLSILSDKLPNCASGYPLYPAQFTTIGAFSSIALWPVAAGVAIQRSTHICEK